MPYDAQPRQTANLGGTGGTTNRMERPQLDWPSTKYREIDMPNAVVMQRASSPAKPTLPRRSEPRTWNATTRERYPLTASLTGAQFPRPLNPWRNPHPPCTPEIRTCSPALPHILAHAPQPGTVCPSKGAPRFLHFQPSAALTQPPVHRITPNTPPLSSRATSIPHNRYSSALTGPGRAGKQGTLLGASGGRYEGEVLAGRPHGRGRYYVKKVCHASVRASGVQAAYPRVPSGATSLAACQFVECRCRAR